MGAILDEAAIPVSEAARAAAENDGRSAWEHALAYGEYFELLFAVSPADGQRLLDDPPPGISLSRIGTVVEGGEIRLRHATGDVVPLAVSGYRHLL